MAEEGNHPMDLSEAGGRQPEDVAGVLKAEILPEVGKKVGYPAVPENQAGYPA